MGTRSRARELALQFLYQWDISGGGSPDELEEALEGFFAALHHPTVARPFAEELVRGTLREVPRLDGLIAHASERWRIDRMTVVDRNVLRLCAFELLDYPQTPERVVLDEAVELARHFGGEESARFVNGVLDRVRIDARPPSR